MDVLGFENLTTAEFQRFFFAALTKILITWEKATNELFETLHFTFLLKNFMLSSYK